MSHLDNFLTIIKNTPKLEYRKEVVGSNVTITIYYSKALHRGDHSVWKFTDKGNFVSVTKKFNEPTKF